MATVESATYDHLLDLIGETIVEGVVNSSGHLILTTKSGSVYDAGKVTADFVTATLPAISAGVWTTVPELSTATQRFIGEFFDSASGERVGLDYRWNGSSFQVRSESTIAAGVLTVRAIGKAT